jgi:hypothetical protein
MRSIRSGERGSALIIAVFVVAILSAMALALTFMGENELKLGRADLRGKRTFYVAEAGLEHGRLALFDNNGKESFDDDLLVAAGGTVDGIELDVDALVPTFDAAGILTGFSTGYGDDVPLLGTTSFGEGAYLAFLTNDPVDGIASTTDTNDRVMIMAAGGTLGGSLEIVQAIVEQEPLLPPTPKAGITLIGPTPVWSPGNSSAKLYTGNDCNGAGEPGLFVPAVGLMNDAAATHVIAVPDKPTYEAGSLAPDDTIVNLNDTSHPAVTDPLDPRWQDCQELHDLVEYLRGKATTLCFDGTACTLPTPAPDNFIFVDDDYEPGPITGEGLLIVTETLTLDGSFEWDGLIMVIGEGHLIRSGAGNGLISGGVVVADVAGVDNIYGNSDDCGTGLQPPTWDTGGGGSGTISYCGAAVWDAFPHAVYRVVEFLQR